MHYTWTLATMETRHRVLIGAEGRWRIVLDQSNGREWLNRSLDDRALKPSFLVCRPLTRLYACADQASSPDKFFSDITVVENRPGEQCI